MNGTLVTPEPHIDRDRFGRPMVIPESGGKPQAFSRVTTFIDAIEDKYALQQWMQRMTAIGLASRTDLLLAVSAHRDDKKKLQQICDEAKEAAAASAAATTGTAYHALTELVDRKQSLPPLSPEATKVLQGYADATKELKATHIEQFTVLDALKVAGTPDRIVKYKGKTFIADIKTGSIEWGALKIAAQLAVYARSKTYDIATGQRGIHGADLERGVIIHLPADGSPCRLYWTDLLQGWNAVLTAKDVRAKRAIKYADLVSPFGPDIAQAAAVAIGDLIREATTADAVRALWAEHSGIWTDELTMTAKARVAELASS